VGYDAETVPGDLLHCLFDSIHDAARGSGGLPRPSETCEGARSDSKLPKSIVLQTVYDYLQIQKESGCQHVLARLTNAIYIDLL